MAQANIKAVITAEDRASGALRGFGNSVENAADRIAGAAKLASAALAAAATAAAVFGVKAAADFQQTRIAFEGLLGSAQNADKMLKQLRDFAARTPFELPGLLKSTQQLLATGTAVEDVIPTMTTLGNVAAALGKGELEIQGVVRALGQMKGKGKAAGQELLQISEQLPGFSAINAIAKDMGVTVPEAFKAMENGAVPADRAIAAILKGMKEFPGAAGAMDRQSKTLNGVISTVKDTFRNALIDGIEPFLPGIAKSMNGAIPHVEGFVKAAINGLKSVIEFLGGLVPKIIEVARQVGDYLEPKFVALWHTLSEDLIPALTRFWKEILEPLVPVIGTVLVAAIGFVVDYLNLWFNILSKVIDFMVNNEWVFWSLVSVLGAVKVALFLEGALAAFKGVMAGAAASFGGLSALVASPLVMPAIAVGAALAAIGLVYNKYMETKRVMEEVANHVISSVNSINAAKSQLQGLSQSSDPAVRERANKALNSGMFRAAGGPVTSNNPYIVGEKGPELFVPNTSGNIIPNGAGGSVSINVNVGMYAGTEMEKRRVAQSLFEALKDVAASKNTTIQRMMG